MCHEGEDSQAERGEGMSEAEKHPPLTPEQLAGLCQEGTAEEIERMLAAGVPPGQIVLRPSRGGWIRVPISAEESEAMA